MYDICVTLSTQSCFQYDTVEQIVSALKADSSDWAMKQLQVMISLYY